MLLVLIALLFAGQAPAQQSLPFSPEDIDIPYQKFTLDNGLRVLIHEDHKAPIVAVNVWYHVGSKNEKPGKTGFAHLFEHLMFNGSEHYNDDYFQALERVGGTDLNGTTNGDRTNYFQNVPVAALDQVLFLESDRMGHLLGAIDQAKLDEQRGVVQNEKRQGENQPYGRQFDLITKAMYPEGHPYSWTTIGEMEDLNAASLEDVEEWFKTYYGPANAVIAIAGDIDPDTVLEKVRKYFGDIPSGPTIARQEVNIPIRLSDTRQTYEDRVPEARVTMVWNTPQDGSREGVALDLAASILGSGKNSRLYKKLVYEDQIASNANAFQWSREIAGNFIVQANAKPGTSIEELETKINEILATFRVEGPTEQELQRAKASVFSGFIKGIERIGGFGGKSDILASNEVYFKNPEYYKTYLHMVEKITTQEIHAAIQQRLGKGKHTLIARPFPEYSTTESDVDRSQGLPGLGEPAVAKFPAQQTATLSNGLKVVLAQRPGVPTMVMRLLFDAGYSADQFGKPGTAALAMNMIDEGTEKMDALEINEQLQLLGASLSAYSDLDASYISMNTLKPSLAGSLDLLAEVVQRPAFPEQDFNRLKDQQLAQIQREKATPIQMALRVMPKFLYGEEHPYSLPLTGSGYEATVRDINRDDVVNFYENWIRPNNATLMVVGDISLDELTAELEARFKNWKQGKQPRKNISTVKAKTGGKIYLMDRPESQQSVIIGGHLVAPYGDISEIARQTMMNVLGGEFTSRLNMNLREDKHWAYGAFSFIQDAKGQRPFIAYAPVQTDKTKESVQEIVKELTDITGPRPITEAEFEKTNTNTVLQLPGQWETNNAVMSSLVEQIKYDLPADYFQTYDRRVRQLELDDVRQLTKNTIHSDDLSFFIVGDKEKILPGLQELGMEIVPVDPDGNPIEENVKAKP